MHVKEPLLKQIFRPLRWSWSCYQDICFGRKRRQCLPLPASFYDAPKYHLRHPARTTRAPNDNTQRRNVGERKLAYCEASTSAASVDLGGPVAFVVTRQLSGGRMTTDSAESECHLQLCADSLLGKHLELLNPFPQSRALLCLVRPDGLVHGP